MLWTYHRDGRQTSYEVNQSVDGVHFELKRRHDDGREELETFQSFAALDKRIQGLRDELAATGWCLAGSNPIRSRIAI